MVPLLGTWQMAYRRAEPKAEEDSSPPPHELPTPPSPRSRLATPATASLPAFPSPQAFHDCGTYEM